MCHSGLWDGDKVGGHRLDLVTLEGFSNLDDSIECSASTSPVTTGIRTLCAQDLGWETERTP